MLWAGEICRRLSAWPRLRGQRRWVARARGFARIVVSGLARETAVTTTTTAAQVLNVPRSSTIRAMIDDLADNRRSETTRAANAARRGATR